MRIVSPNKLVKASGGMLYKPFNRYVVSDYEHLFLEEHTPSTKWTWSSFNAWERRYGGQDLNGKRVIVYRHSAWGDQLMASAVPHYLKTMYPDAHIDLYCDPSVADLWLGSPYIGGSAIPIPIPFDCMQHGYDYHILYEGMLEANGEWDQHNAYDDMFGVIGLNPPDRFKHPFIPVRPDDMMGVSQLGIDFSMKYMVYHLAPSNMNRCYPIHKGMEFVNLFLENRPDWSVVVVGVMPKGKYLDTYDRMRPKFRCVDLVNRTSRFRQLIPVIERASMVVCPDSSVMHLTAAFPDVPMITLWGLFGPDDRAKYYTNDHPLWNPDVCPHAPCHNHDFELPRGECKDALGYTDELEYCRALDSIRPDEIMSVANSLSDRCGPPSSKPLFPFGVRSRFSLVHPSRGRPEKALLCFLTWYKKFSKGNELEYILSLDTDDAKNYLDVVKELRCLGVKFRVCINDNESVVSALNFGAKQATGDVLIYLSDDFDCPEHWDTKIQKAVSVSGKEVNSGEWVLHVNDGHQLNTCTISILSRAYYQRFGYIYYPEYFSVYVDNDFTEVAYKLGCVVDGKNLVFKHNHYMWGEAQFDATYQKENENARYAEGEALLKRRRAEGFGLTDKEVKDVQPA